MSVKRVRLRADGFFVLRTPLLPVDLLQQWSSGLKAPGAGEDRAALDEAVKADRALLRGRLAALVERPDVREALFVASPSLEGTLPEWLKAPEGERGQKVERALVRYFERMAARPTPFGLFAGCAVGGMGERTALTVPAGPALRRQTRLDMGYLFSLSTALARDPQVRQELTYFPNSSLYEVAGRLRFAETQVEDRARRFNLVVVEPNPYLAATLERASGGARLEALAQGLVQDDAEISIEEARQFVVELVDGQLLVPELEPHVTGPESMHGLMETLRPAAGTEPARIALQALEQVEAGLKALDAAGVGQPSSRYLELAKALEPLPVKADLSQLFQVDLMKAGVAPTLGPKVVTELVRVVGALQKMRLAVESEPLKRFREAFVKRYEAREVPVVEALDDEAGVGFDASGAPEATPLLEGIALGGGAPSPASFHERHARLLHHLVEAARLGRQEVQLSESDLEALGEPDRPIPELPDSMAVSATVFAASSEAVDRGDFRLSLQFAGGVSGVSLLGRFVEADASLRRFVERHLRAQEALQPEAVFAEIVHLPEGRMGNILHRPVLRDYEIVYLGRSGAPRDRQLPITDLLVSVAGDEIRLRSRRLAKEIIPRLTNAHNHGLPNNPALYRFLCLVQERRRKAALGFDWGPLANAPFLPRVCLGRTVLAWARWRLAGPELKSLGEGTYADRFLAIQRLRRARGLPRHLVLADFDNQLPIDLDNALSVETFCHLVKGRPSAELSEAGLKLAARAASGPEGHYAHELVIPFTRERPEAEASGSRARWPPLRISGQAHARSFPPGSEWLYAKLYAGSLTVDRLLREAVAPVLEALAGRGAFDRWFFIRYGDPDWHLRLRFHGVPEVLQAEVLPQLQRAALPWVADRQLWRLELDTYEREEERYGGPVGVDLAERLFHVDSEAVLQIVQTLSGNEGLDARWRLGLRGADMLLDDLLLSPDRKRAVMERAAKSFAKELGMEGDRAHQLSERFRLLRAQLEPLVLRSADEGSDLQPGFRMLAERSGRLKPIADALRRAEAAGELTASIEDLAPSYVHMHLNRMLRSSQRPQEMAIYDFLARLYRSQAVRRTKGG